MSTAVTPFIKHLTSVHRKTVLLIDVNTATRELRAKSLRSRGVTVDCASSAAAGWLRYESATYDLVLLDLAQDHTAAQGLAEQMRLTKHGQKVAFFVDGPAYISFKQTPSLVQRPEATSSSAADAKQPTLALQPRKPLDFGEQVRKAEADRDRYANF